MCSPLSVKMMRGLGVRLSYTSAGCAKAAVAGASNVAASKVTRFLM
jgi:hypothetical protein